MSLPATPFVSSTDAELAHWTARGNMGTLATVKSLGASMDDVMARLDLYAEYIPKRQGHTRAQEAERSFWRSSGRFGGQTVD